MKKQVWIWLMILAAMVCFLTVLTSQIQQFARITHLLTGQNTKELLRQQEVPAELYDMLDRKSTRLNSSHWS